MLCHRISRMFWYLILGVCFRNRFFVSCYQSGIAASKFRNFGYPRNLLMVWYIIIHKFGIFGQIKTKEDKAKSKGSVQSIQESSPPLLVYPVQVHRQLLDDVFLFQYLGISAVNIAALGFSSLLRK